MHLCQNHLKQKIIYMHKKNVAQVIRETIFYCMKKDKDIILFGEGIDDNAAMFNTTSGTTKAFGKNRVFEMPLSENCIVGAAIGASIEGDKVIINFQRVEFALLALEQIINNAAKTSYITSAKHNVPIVIRLVIGKGWGQGPVHSQSLEGLFASIPGLKVMMPVFPNETKNLLFEAINDPNPVIFIENRWCHYLYGNIDKKYKKKNSPIVKLNNGRDLTILSNGYFSAEVFKISKFLKKFDINLDMLHLRILNKNENSELFKSVKKTRKILTVDSSYKNYGVSSEILTNLFEKFDDFKIKPRRIGIPFHPMPSSRGYISSVYPTKEKILKNILQLVNVSNQKSKIIFSSFKNTFDSKTSIDQPHTGFQGPF